ncbi:agmatine deiminase family protein [Desulforamulus ruminis]|uniref:Agmatine deiminase n=1 Tax=Desulforamulus ruminis (strain ATCC 23193 / DSM 2154 / NCIMB 8452 / DL) TaxID=696281 RepID=F6DK01_DESRL|nr:agmatine deiminase family protein [Desulforamulus ruminis]AEG60315.1 Agmatine deiminase [Desulforamulus ruminis DSM 2154]
MKKTYSIILVIFLCLLVIMIARDFNQQPSKKAMVYPFPAEFNKQQAVWLQWPSEIYNTDRPVYPVILNIIKSLDPYIRINLMVRSQEETNQIKDLLKNSGYTVNNVHYYVVNHMSIWTRDVGPIFVKSPQNKLQVVDFGFNNYSRSGNPDYIAAESQVDRLAAKLLNLPVIKTDLISEGGAIESNGRGTMMVTESVALSRNPKMSKAEIEKEYKRVLGVKKVIWLKKGLAEDDPITTGHIDEIARFANPNAILLAQVLPGDRYTNAITQESYRRMEENYEILRNATDQDGKPFHIIRIPMPPTIYGKVDETGKIPVLSYLNYAVTNGAVLMQTYWQSGRSEMLKTTENQVKDTLQKVFPGRRIIGINVENVNRWGGGIHCITQHMPE